MQQLFSRYLKPGTTLHGLVKRLRETAVPTPSGRGCWRGGTVRNILRNPAYAGQACGNRYQCIPARQRSSALRPTGKGISHRLRPEDEWVTIAVPPLVSREEFALVHMTRQQHRLLDAYVAGVVELPELERKKRELTRRQSGLLVQLRQLHAQAAQHVERQTIADGLEAFCGQGRAGLAQATFDQQRLLIELLVDRVIVTDSVVEIRYAFPTTRDGPHRPFCQLRLDYRGGVPERVPDIRGSPRQSGAIHRRRLKHQALTLEPRLPTARRVRDAPPDEQKKLACPMVWQWGSSADSVQ